MGIFSRLKQAFAQTPKPLDGRVDFDELEIRVYPPTEKRIRWDEIDRIVTYKIDLLPYDEIRVQFESSSDAAIVVTEESPGFDDFMQEVVRRYPSTQDWHGKESQPAFAECWTVLFDINDLRT
jgi:hypothetical protein